MATANAFGKVRRRGEILIVTALKPAASDEEFHALVEEAEAGYENMPDAFVLVIDMMEMGPLPVKHAMLWMQMFERVMPITRERLICTCICFSNPLVRAAVNVFLALYSPVKPFHVYDHREECLRAAQLALEQKSEHNGVVDQNVQGGNQPER